MYVTETEQHSHPFEVKARGLVILNICKESREEITWEVFTGKA